MRLVKLQTLCESQEPYRLLQKYGACSHAVVKTARQYLKRGIDNFVVVEGWVDDESGRNIQHVWIEFGHKIIDPQRAQFIDPTYKHKNGRSKAKIYSPYIYVKTQPFDKNWKSLLDTGQSRSQIQLHSLENT